MGGRRCGMGLAVLASMALTGLAAPGAERGPVRVIFDTDIGGDVDDVGAVAVLHALADQGEADILAMSVCVADPWSAPCLDALNAWYGRGEIPIGVVKEPAVHAGSKYVRQIAEAFPHRLKSASDAPDAVDLYRRTLAAQPDGSVVLITVGFLTNVARLLDSPPDAHSPLAGVDLARRKSRAWVAMAGAFPRGREWNVQQDAASARRAIDLWPGPIVFSGFEIGEPIMTGAGLKATPVGNPARRAYELFNGLCDRSSWDQTAVLFGVRGLDGAPLNLWRQSPPGDNRVLSDGSNAWSDSPDRGRRYLVPIAANDTVAKTIEALMIQPPRRATR